MSEVGFGIEQGTVNKLELQFINEPSDPKLCQFIELQRAEREQANLVASYRAKEDDQELDEALSEYVDLGKEFVNDLRLKFGLQKLDKSEMRVLFLKESEYDGASRAIGGTPGEHSHGFVSRRLDYAFVKLKSQNSDLFTAAVAVHELIHQNLDLKVNVYSIWGGEPGRNPSRTGLRTVMETRSGQEQESGQLLNELGNHLAEFKFVQSLVHDGGRAQNDWMLLEAAAKRKFGDQVRFDEDRLTVSTRDGAKVKLDLNSYLFYLSDEARRAPARAFVTQLGLDLERLCGDVDGRPFYEVLLEAKTRPRVQNLLRKAINEKMGSGFYEELKASSYESSSILSLLEKLQTRMAEEVVMQ